MSSMTGSDRFSRRVSHLHLTGDAVDKLHRGYHGVEDDGRLLTRVEDDRVHLAFDLRTGQVTVSGSQRSTGQAVGSQSGSQGYTSHHSAQTRPKTSKPKSEHPNE